MAKDKKEKSGKGEEIKPVARVNVENREISAELQESYLDYAMSVIVSRALPDVRDGLKPVHRRILWGMWESGATAGTKTRKSANIVGEVMGRYHPHGDAAIYDAITRMAQDFSLRYPFVEGQGNWGSIDGDNAAAMRYCVSGDTFIPTDHGIKKIKDIAPDTGEDIDIKILSKDKQINSANKWFDSGKHPTLKITTERGYTLQGSYNHPILTWNKNKSDKPTFSWKTLETVASGDIAVLDRSIDILWPTTKFDLTALVPSIKNRRLHLKKLPKYLSEDLGFILGALVSEGSITADKIEFCNSDFDFIKEFKERWKQTFPDCRLHEFQKKPSSFGKKPYWRLEIHSHYVIAFLRALGLSPVRSAKKEVPFSILQSPQSVVTAFLQSYFEGDGTITDSGKMIELSCCSVSEQLINQLQIVLLRFGIASAKRFDKYRNLHKLYIRGRENYLLFQNMVGFFSQRKKERLQEVVSRLHKDNAQTDAIPFLASFIRDLTRFGELQRQFVLKNNFDRYVNLERNQSAVITALQPTAQLTVQPLVGRLLKNHYLFDSIKTVEKTGIERVYSLRVNSSCHSFIGNGFINHNTEARLMKIAEEMLADIDKETINWRPNYDGTRQEPSVLPAKLPNLLLNGAVGIAVGMATNIPPNNLGEIADAVLHLADNPKATSQDLLQFVQGPDFPTGGIIYDKKAIAEAYVSGHGTITTRGTAEIKEKKGASGKEEYYIEITEIPYQVNKSELIIKIAELVTTKKIEGIRDVRDESDKDGLSIVIEFKSNAAPQKILNQLYEFTDLQKNFNMNMIALAGGLQPELMSLKDVLAAYLAHRNEVVRRRAQFELKKAEERAHILMGLSKALSVIDKVIATIKKSNDRDDAKVNLIKNFKFSERQTDAILEMKLQTLANLERQKIENELAEKKKLIAELTLLLKSPAKILKVIKDEVAELKAKFGDERRTKVIASALGEFKEEDLIPAEETIITLSQGGYIKRVPSASFKTQGRGGKGLIGSEVNEEDFLSHFIAANTHDNILFFTDKGRVFQTKVYEIPPATRTAKGKPIHNFLEIPTEEKVNAIIAYGSTTANAGQASSPQAGKTSDGHLVMVTKNGMIKKTSLKDFQNVRRNGIIAISLKKADLLKWVKLSSGNDDIVITTSMGQAIRFKEAKVRTMGRVASGVRGIRLKGSDQVASMDLVTKDAKDAKLLVVMANGFGKQTAISQYKVQGRGGSGVKTAKITSKTGQLISAHLITDEEELLALSAKGQVIRTPLSAIRVASRATQGVRIMALNPGDKVAGIVCL